MSYDIYIGEAKIGEIEPDDDPGVALDVVVASTEHPKAPEFPGDEMTGKSNGRHPGYSQFAEFCERVGLYGLFFDKWRGLMREHPGTVALDKTHLQEVRRALDAHRTKFKNIAPGWCKCEACDEFVREEKRTPHIPAIVQCASGDLARLIWFEWWMSWALENCKRPALYNH